MTYKQIITFLDTHLWARLIAAGVVCAMSVDRLYPDIKYKVKDTVVKPFKAVKEKFSKKAN